MSTNVQTNNLAVSSNTSSTDQALDELIDQELIDQFSSRIRDGMDKMPKDEKDDDEDQDNESNHFEPTERSNSFDSIDNFDNKTNDANFADQDVFQANGGFGQKSGKADLILDQFQVSHNFNNEPHLDKMDQDKIKEDEAETDDKLDQYSANDHGVIEMLQEKFTEAQDNNDFTAFHEVATKLAKDIDPEFVGEIEAEADECCEKLQDVQERFKNGDATKDEVNQENLNANDTIKSMQNKLKSYLVKHNAHSAKNDKAAPQSSSMQSCGSVSSSESSSVSSSESSSTSSTSSYADDPIEVGSISLNNASDINSLLSGSSGGNISIMVIVVVVFLKMSQISADTVMGSTAVMAATADDQAYMNDALSAYNALAASTPYYYTDPATGNQVEVTDPYTLVAIAMAPEDSPYYDPALASSMEPFISFMEEYYPDSFDSIYFYNPGEQNEQEFYDDVCASENAFTAIMTDFYNTVDQAAEDTGGEPCTRATLTTVTYYDDDGEPVEPPMSYQAYDFVYASSSTQAAGPNIDPNTQEVIPGPSSSGGDADLGIITSFINDMQSNQAQANTVASNESSILQLLMQSYSDMQGMVSTSLKFQQQVDGFLLPR